MVNKQTRKIGNEPGFPRLLAERLCLDFVNSFEDPFHEAIEFLTDYSALATWGSHTGLYSHDEARALIAQGEAQPELARTVFEQAIMLRSDLERIFRPIAHHEPAPASELQRFQELYRQLLGDAELQSEEGHYHWHWIGSPLQQVTWAVVLDALDLLQSDQLGRVKHCPGTDDCDALFFDTSKNQSRQWCSMEGCGSRAKMRRQYARQKHGG
jgi:predicted RNA-binding Zn ribbon-like protein